LIAVDDGAERVDLLALHQDIDLDQVGALLAVLMVVERRVALGAAFELVEEVEDDLRQRDAVVHLDALGANVLHRAHFAAMLLAQVHHRADEFLGRDDVGGDHRLDDLLDLAFGELARIGDLMQRAVLGGHVVGDVGRGGDQIQPEFAAEPLRDDFHMQQPQESAAEPEPERHRGLRLIDERGVVKLELVERLAQLRELALSIGNSPEYTMGLGSR
jgi:hypothetical protein